MFEIHISVVEFLLRLILGEELRALVPRRQAKFQVPLLAYAAKMLTVPLPTNAGAGGSISLMR